MVEELDPSLLYVLDAEGNPTPTEDSDEWLRFKIESSRIKQTSPSCVAPNGFISTVFLGQVTFDGNIFESMGFNIEGYSKLQWRYRTRAEALEGHDTILTMLENDPNLRTT